MTTNFPHFEDGDVPFYHREAPEFGNFMVAFRDDTLPDGTPGPYTLSSKVFKDKNHAMAYSLTINPARRPVVLCVTDVLLAEE